MRIAARTRAIAAGALLLCARGSFGAEPQASESPRTLNGTELQAAILEKLTELSARNASAKNASTEEPNDAIAETVGRALPETKQVRAPSAAKPDSTLVDAASFPALVGAAFDNDLLKLDHSAFTTDLNLFAFVALASPEVLDRQSQYGRTKYRLMRRFAGSLTVGGKGDSFDRDGDGRADPPLAADSLGDIVTWEVKARVIGTRDRRDRNNLARYLAERLLDRNGSKSEPLAALADNVSAGITDFVTSHLPELKIDARGNADADAVKALLASRETADALGALALDNDLLDKAAEAALRDIDGSLVWTVVAGGTRQRDQFGPDKWHLGLRGAFSTGRFDHAINVDWLKVDGIGGARRGTTWKGGFQVSTLLLKGSQLTEDGVSLALSVAAEHATDVPDAAHATIARAGVTLQFPLSKSVAVPLSINYANHRDLLTDENAVVGNIGLAIDLSAVRKKS